jgi:hypothetical protein
VRSSPCGTSACRRGARALQDKAVDAAHGGAHGHPGASPPRGNDAELLSSVIGKGSVAEQQSALQAMGQVPGSTGREAMTRLVESARGGQARAGDPARRRGGSSRVEGSGARRAARQDDEQAGPASRSTRTPTPSAAATRGAAPAWCSRRRGAVHALSQLRRSGRERRTQSVGSGVAAAARAAARSARSIRARASPRDSAPCSSR